MGVRRTRAGGAKKRPTRYGPDGDTSAELAAALRSHRKGRFAEAAAGYRAVLAEEPECADAWMNLGAACVSLGSARGAAAAFAEALRLCPDDPRALRDAGIGLAAIGRFDAARSALARAVAHDPTLVGARLFLSRVCADTGDREAAVAHARSAVATAPDDASTHIELHRALFDDRAVEPCLSPIRRALELAPDSGLARVFLDGALAVDASARGATPRPIGDRADPMRDALAYALERRVATTRVFSTARATLLHALASATLDGPVVELGVRHGISSRTLAEHGTGPVHAFDSFAGLPEPWGDLPAGAFGTGGELPDVPANVELHVGLFDDTLPAALRRGLDPPRLVHVDSDLYSSARTALAHLGPAMRPGCVVVFDEYLGHASWRDDEHRAFREAVARFGWSYEYLALGWLTGQGVVRLLDR